MKKLIIAVGLTIGSAGCAGYVPGSDTVAYWKPNINRAEATVEYQDCIIEGVQTIPSAMTISSTPGYSSPGATYCSGDITVLSQGFGPPPPPGSNSISCQTNSGINIAPTVSSYDSNLDIKLLYIKRCMANKGYKLKPMKICMDKNDQSMNCALPVSLK
jgi:hypothetical protein